MQVVVLALVIAGRGLISGRAIEPLVIFVCGGVAATERPAKLLLLSHLLERGEDIVGIRHVVVYLVQAIVALLEVQNRCATGLLECFCRNDITFGAVCNGLTPLDVERLCNIDRSLGGCGNASEWLI
jgi:hypothetical protein